MVVRNVCITVDLANWVVTFPSYAPIKVMPAGGEAGHGVGI